MISKPHVSHVINVLGEAILHYLQLHCMETSYYQRATLSTVLCFI